MDFRQIKADNLWIKFYFSTPNFRYLEHSSEPNLIICVLKRHLGLLTYVFGHKERNQYENKAENVTF